MAFDEQITARSLFTHVLIAQPLVSMNAAVAWNAKHCNANATACLT